jgi:hypothetical protein
MNILDLSKLAKNSNKNFLNGLMHNNESFHFLPVKEGITPQGEKLKLGFSVYSLKMFYMTGEWDILDKKKQSEWIKFINSFQSTNKLFPENSYIDNEYLNYFKKNRVKIIVKDSAKRLLNAVTNKNYELNSRYIQNSVRAETKQCIATLSQVGQIASQPYLDFPKQDLAIFLDNFDWTQPWGAGAQFSGLSVFITTQINDKKESDHLLDAMSDFIMKKVNSNDGAYYVGNQPSKSEAINGAMKVLTGLDWLGINIHYPKKLIDLCLNTVPNSEGCDLVDIVYVLYRCSLETDYRKTEIVAYLENLELLISLHFYEDQGGFSYFTNRSQQNYYGVKISNGHDTPDIHGTILLTWALAMIHEIISPADNPWKIIKP